MTEQEQFAADYPEAWKPEPGEKIAGQVVSVTMGPDMGYGPYPIVTLNVEGKERAIHAFHQVLRTELARRRPRQGDQLEIVYGGTRKPKSGNGNPFHVYRVKGGQEPEFDWASEMAPEDRERAQAQSAEPPIPSAPVPQAPPTEPVGSQFEDSVPF